MIRKGLAVAVILLFIGVAFAPSINATVSKSSVEPIADVDIKEENATPIQLVLQLLNKLRNHKDIQNVESEDDILQIIEEDKELNIIYEQLSNDGEDCNCGDEISPLRWSFPILWSLLAPLLILSLSVWMMSGVDLPLVIMGMIGGRLNCFWY